LLNAELSDLESAARVVYAAMTPTPQQRWPLLDARCGTSVWVKHENHTPVGAFKIRGGLVYFDHLRRIEPNVKGVVAATRGNHGQSIGFAASRLGIPAAVVVPQGNSETKKRRNARAGRGVSREGSRLSGSTRSERRDCERARLAPGAFVSSASRSGVASYSLELLRAAPIDVLYVPIGLGSGICGAIAVRDALNLQTRIVGVVSAAAPTYARSLALGRPVSSEVTTRIADGMACRTPNGDALEIIRAGVDHVVEVTDDEVEDAMRALFSDTHNVVEGAGAASLPHYSRNSAEGGRRRSF
jgi:threonine dehydratase